MKRSRTLGLFLDQLGPTVRVREIEIQGQSDELNITNIVRSNENKHPVEAWIEARPSQLTRSPAKAAAERPINKAIFTDDVGAREIAPGASVIAVQCVVAHHQVVIRADSADG